MCGNGRVRGRDSTSEIGDTAGVVAEQQVGTTVAREVGNGCCHATTFPELVRHPIDGFHKIRFRLLENAVQVAVNILVVSHFALLTAAKKHRTVLRIAVKTRNAVTKIRQGKISHIHTAKCIGNLLKFSNIRPHIAIIGQQPAPVPDNQIPITVAIQVEKLRGTTFPNINAGKMRRKVARTSLETLVRHEKQRPVIQSTEHIREPVAVEIPESWV